MDERIAAQCAAPTDAVLVGARITFLTHDDDLETDSYVNVFVRNQPPDGSLVLPQRDLIGNRLDWERHQQTALTDRNPFLASGGPLGAGETWREGSAHGPFQLDLPLTPVLRRDVGIPVVDVHLLTEGSDRWMFSWTLELEFSAGPPVTSTSDTDAVAGIVLDQDNPDYMGLGAEETGVARPPRQVPDTDAVLSELTVAFRTRGDLTRGTRLQDLRFEDGEIVISYTGPQGWEPPMPPDWPASFTRDIGNLSKIEHIVVLTMENRSFDHMIGYLSLPSDTGGAGRDDVRRPARRRIQPPRRRQG